MSTHVEAVYENGVFRPLQPVQLPEHQRVTVSINDEAEGGAGSDEGVHFILSTERWRAFCEALDAPTRDIPTLRKLLTEKGLFDEHRGAFR